MKKVLVPPPVNKADEIVAVSGGMYYAQEAAGMPLLHRGGATLRGWATRFTSSKS